MRIELRQKACAGERLSPEEALEIYQTSPLWELGAVADAVRQLRKPGRIVTYIIDRNINYTNVCDVYCKFCAFYRTAKDADAYVLSHEEIDRKIAETVAAGGTQILMQGGHHPALGLEFYLEMLAHIRARWPAVNIHAFSPPEIVHFSRVFGMPVEEVMRRFRDAGWGSLPGGGAEILVDLVRKRIAPRKCTSAEWLEVMETAHGMGISSSATMMFGHVETVAERIEHLRRLRELQDRTGGFTAFICWTYQAENTRLRARPQGAYEYLRTQALARLFLDNFPNIQSSWVTQGDKIGQLGLKFGANDLGSLMLEENVVSSAGTTHCMTLEKMRRLIADLGYEPRQRDNWYRMVPGESL